jgi:hypothetical protein
MKRSWLLPLAALSLAGAVSVAQAAPASPVLATLKIDNPQSAGEAQLVSWRRYHHRRHHHHRYHRHHRHHR